MQWPKAEDEENGAKSSVNPLPSSTEMTSVGSGGSCGAADDQQQKSLSPEVITAFLAVAIY